MSARHFNGSIWKTGAAVWYRCPHFGFRQVTVQRQLKSGEVWVSDMHAAYGRRKVHPSTLSAEKPI